MHHLPCDNILPHLGQRIWNICIAFVVFIVQVRPPAAIQRSAASQLASGQAAGNPATRNLDVRNELEAGQACCQQPAAQTASQLAGSTFSGRFFMFFARFLALPGNVF